MHVSLYYKIIGYLQREIERSLQHPWWAINDDLLLA